MRFPVQRCTTTHDDETVAEKGGALKEDRSEEDPQSKQSFGVNGLLNLIWNL